MKPLLFFTLLLSLAACHPRKSSGPEKPGTVQSQDSIVFQPPKNIVLMIGDGMGLTQITAGMYVNGNKLNLEQFTFVGLHKSYASNDLVTDSAAGATALASGVKTYNGAVGVDKSGKPVSTILEEAEDAGFETGLVVTSSITHATPACFYAHQQDRIMIEEIAFDILRSDVDFFVGGGKRFFDRRKDGKNLISELESRDYFISDYFTQDFKDITVNFEKKFGYFTADTEPLPSSQGRDYLAQATQTALTYLDSQDAKGFFSDGRRIAN